MMTIYKSHFGNPSSIHSIDARRYLDESRRTVAKLLNAKPRSHFTSATESNNTAIKGLVYANEHLEITLLQQIEHHSVLHVFEQLEKKDMMSLI